MDLGRPLRELEVKPNEKPAQAPAPHEPKPVQQPEPVLTP